MNSWRFVLLTLASALLSSCAAPSPLPPPAAPAGMLLLHVLLKPEKPDELEAPGEQCMTHQLVLVDLGRPRIVSSVTLGPSVLTAYAPETHSVWVAQSKSEKDGGGTRLRELRLSDFQPLSDVTLPIRIGMPTDAAGQFLSNPGIFVVGPRQLILSANQADSVGSDILRITVNAPDRAAVEELGVARPDIVGLVKAEDGTPLLLLDSGKTLRPEQRGARTVLQEEEGLTPIDLDGAASDGIWQARNGGPDGSVVAVSIGGMFFKRRWAEGKTFHLETDAVYPQDLSVDPTGRRVAIRYQPDPNQEKNGLMVVDLGQWREVYQGDLEGAGAILLLSPTQVLQAAGNALFLLDLSDPEHPVRQELLKVSDRPIERVLNGTPVSR